MNFNYLKFKNVIWIVPALIAFLIALIPTFNLQWPLTADIFFQIHIAQIYTQYGLTLTDPLIDPGLGHKIGYPPLFGLVMALLVKIFSIDYLQAGKLLQPILAFSTVLSISYVTKKFYGDIAAISTGFLVISSYLFSRLVSPLPETMSLIFVPLIVYFYYKSVEEKNYLYSLISGTMFILIVITNQATTLNIFLVITAVALVLLIIRRDFRYLLSYIGFLLIPVAMGTFAFVVYFFINPISLQNIITIVLNTTNSLPFNEPISYLKYVAYLGIVVIFALVGGILALKKRRDQDIIVIVWISTIFLISKSYWFGINVYSIRLLIHLLIPVSILGGLGLSYLYNDVRIRDFSSVKIRSMLLIVVFGVSSLFAVNMVNDPTFPLIPKYDIYYKEVLINPQIAPPTESDMELAQWFKEQGNKEKILISNNYNTNQFLLAMLGTPIASIQSSEHCIVWGFTKKELKAKNIGYFIFDKRLTYSSQNNKIFSDIDPLNRYIDRDGLAIYLNNDTYNPKNILIGKMVLVYENKDYIVFKSETDE